MGFTKGEQGQVAVRLTSLNDRQRPAFWSAIFMIINWVLGCAFIVQPMVLADKIFYFLVCP